LSPLFSCKPVMQSSAFFAMPSIVNKI
jgi:hypothetical protein